MCTLASQPSKDNVRCLVQCLKCCGSVLEEEERSKPGSGGATPSMDRTMEVLERLAGKEGLEEGLAEALVSLVRLRAAHWGHSPPGSVATQVNTDRLPAMVKALRQALAPPAPLALLFPPAPPGS